MSLEEKIDQLTRNKIAKLMNVPANMVSKSTDLYKSTFKEIEENYTDYPNDDMEEDDEIKINDKIPSKLELNEDIIKNNNINNNINENDYKAFKNDFNKNTLISNNGHENIFNINGKDINKKINWLNLPNTNDLENYQNCNHICKHLVRLYKERYNQIEKQLLELKDLVNDIDKYSNYK